MWQHAGTTLSYTIYLFFYILLKDYSMLVSFTKAFTNRLPAVILCILSVLPSLLAQTLQPNSPTKEYIRLGGQVIAIENGNATGAGGGTGGGGTGGGGTGQQSSYGYRRTLTISHTLVANTDQTNFPVLFSGTYPFLATTPNGGKVQNPNGYDLIFASDSAGQRKLNWEVEKYDPATGSVVFWIQVPNLSHTVDTTIYLFYGNSAITTNQSNAAGTWDSNYSAVYHFASVGGSLSGADSTGNHNDLTATNASITRGVIGTAVGLPGTNSWLIRPNPVNVPTGSSPRTIEAWFNRPAGSSDEENNGGVGSNDYNGSRFDLRTFPGHAGVEIRVDGTNKDAPYTPDGRWHFLAGTLPSGKSTAADILVYFDGATYHSTGGTTVVNTTATELAVGRAPTVDFLSLFSGQMDEFRVSKIDRSTDWLTTEYNNQTNPSGFVMVGTDQSSQTGGSAAVSIDFVGEGSAMDPSELAGVVPEGNWNNAVGSAGTVNLLDQNGAATAATATWSSDGGWSLPISDFPGNYRMMGGYLDDYLGGTTSVTLSGLPSSASGYSVYVYVDGDNPSYNRTGIYSISGSGTTPQTIQATDPGNTDYSGGSYQDGQGVFTQANNSTGNYVVFTVPGTSFTLTANPGYTNSNYPRAPVNGIQIVPITSASPTHVISGHIKLIRIRSRWSRCYLE